MPAGERELSHERAAQVLDELGAAPEQVAAPRSAARSAASRSTCTEPVRGRQLVMVNGAVLADDETAAGVLAELRELAPEIDTFGRVPSASLVRLHMDPEGPTPGVTSTSVLGSLPDEAVDAFLRVVGHGTSQSLLAAELRQLGGALGRPAEGAGAVPMVNGQFVLFAVAIAATPELAEAGQADADALVAAMWPWANGAQYLNFVEHDWDPRAGYDEVSWARLQQVRAAVDPAGTFVANHQVPLATSDTVSVPSQR